MHPTDPGPLSHSYFWFGGRKYGHLNYRKPAAEDVISAAGCFLPRINKASQS